MIGRMIGVAVSLVAASALGAPKTPNQSAEGKWTKMVNNGKELYATFQTTEGEIVVRLFSKDAPKTVANFVGLATGEKEWTDPRNHQTSKKPLYDGTLFHRVIPNFMIQGGDPNGTGMGDPGYRFEDEFQSGRKFDKVGLLAMANAGPNTNGSQFFITTSTPQHLNNKHTIFGEVVSGYEVVEKIAAVPRDRRDKPNKDVVIKKVIISDKAPKSAASQPEKAEKSGKG